MACGLGHNFFSATGQLVWKHKYRSIAIPIKTGQIGDTARQLSKPVQAAASNDHTDSILDVTRAGFAEFLHSGILGGDVHLIRGVVLSHPLPDRLNVIEFGIAKIRHIEVDRIGRCHNRIPSSIVRIPKRRSGRVPIKIEINHLGCPRTAVKQEGLSVGQGTRCRGTTRGRSGTSGNSFAGIKKTPGFVSAKIMISRAEGP